ncbi:MAG: hypothetical protein WCP85_13440 [Mariniphaga sp.]
MRTELTKQDILELLDRQAKEFHERILESDRKLDMSIEKSRLEFDERLKKSQKESEKSRRDFNKRFGQITGTWGKFVAEMVKPRIIKLFKDKGIPIKTTLQNVVGLLGDENYYEIDLLLINSKIAVAVEIKSSLSVDDVKEHLERLEKIQKVQPERIDLSGATLMGAVAGMIVENDADKYAYKQGLYVLRQKGNLVEIMNDDKFMPKEWKVNY